MSIQVGLRKWSVYKNRPVVVRNLDSSIFNEPLTLLIHGFGVTKTKAMNNQYRPFRKYLFDYSCRDIAEIYWYKNRHMDWYYCGRMPGLLQGLQGLQGLQYRWEQYPIELDRAIQCGMLLSSSIKKFASEQDNNQTNLDLVLIGHSLGCRLILEALRDLSNLSNQSSEKSIPFTIILMGAAVPISLLNNQSYQELRNVISRLRQAIVLYSKNDPVLDLPFKMVQKKANDGLEDGTDRLEAVGLYGNPAQGIWHCNDILHELKPRISMDYFRHNIYWKKEKTVKKIANFLRSHEMGD